MSYRHVVDPSWRPRFADHAQGWAYHSFRPSAGDGWDRGGVIGNVPVATWDRDGITVVPGVEHPDWLRTYLG